eukprot:jgi/Botrbrau1/6409/Bobra.49_1s0026.1
MHINNRLALNIRDVLLEQTCKLDSCQDRAASTTQSDNTIERVEGFSGKCYGGNFIDICPNCYRLACQWV